MVKPAFIKNMKEKEYNMKFPHVKQHDEKDCGAACLSMISEFYGLKLKIAQFRELIKVDRNGVNIYGIVSGAKKLGLDADALEGSNEELAEGIGKREISFPFIARIVNEHDFEHYIVVYGVNKKGCIIGDPGKDRIEKMTYEMFEKQWQGQIITFCPNDTFQPRNERKGSFRKFFKYITVQKKTLGFIFLASIIMIAVNLFGSTVFQYVVDDAIAVGDVSGEYTEACQDPECDEEHVHGTDTDEVCEDPECEDGHVHESDVVNENENKTFIDKMQEKLDVIFSNLNTVCISVIVLYVLSFVIRIVRGYLLALMGKKIAVPLTLDYYDHLIDLPIGFFGTRKTGELISRFSDTENIRQAISTTTLTIMLDSIMAVACGIYLFCMNHLLFFVTLVILLLYGLVMFCFVKPIRRINYEIMEEDAQVTSYLKESIEGIETIKSYGYEDGAKLTTGKTYKGLTDKIVKGSVVFSIQEALVSLISSVGIVVLLWVGAYLCIEDKITVGILMTFYYLLEFFLEPVENLINLQPTLQTAIVAGERLNDVLDTEVEEMNCQESDMPSGDIHIENIDFRYGSRKLSLDNVNLDIKEGKKVAIVGENGCGKTTLIKLLMTFYKPEKGSITIGDMNVADISKSLMRKNVAYISQNVFLFSDSITNNLRLGDDSISDDEIKEVCKKCYLDEFINSLPFGYDTIIEENGNNLSGGQKQRLAIARALLRKPKILIMDEATSNLDMITQERINKMIDGFSDNLTRVVIAHKIEEIRSCDYIYVMDKGTVVEHGTYKELEEKAVFA